MIGYIYKTVHNSSGKIYIGKRQKPKFDAKYYGSGVVLKPAIAKYGREAFSVDVLEWCETKEELCEAEKLWIKKYRESGADMYNIADGGDGGCLVKWWEFGEERCKEIIRQNSEAHKGERNPMYGKHHPEETKERIRKAMAGCKWPEERNRKLRETKRKHLLPVAQIDLKTDEIIEVFENWVEAAHKVIPNKKYAYAHISECCKGERKSAYGYKWKTCNESGWTL